MEPNPSVFFPLFSSYHSNLELPFSFSVQFCPFAMRFLHAFASLALAGFAVAKSTSGSLSIVIEYVQNVP